MSTRIGRFIFEDDLENMSVEKLMILKEGCEHFIKEKHREEIHQALTEINLRAHTYGFDICIDDADGYPWVMNEVRLNIKERKTGE
jgi:hypothetical protein